MIFWIRKGDRVTGQKIVTDAVVDIFKNEHTVIFYELSLIYLLSYIKLCMYILSGNRRIYFVPSRSRRGSIRDWPLLLLQIFGIELFGHLHGADGYDFLRKIKSKRLIYFFYKNIKYISPSKHLTDGLELIGYNCSTIENFFQKRSVETVQNLNSEEFLKDETIKEAISACGGKYVVLWNSNILASKGIIETLELLYPFGKRDEVVFIVFGEFVSDAFMTSKELEKRCEIYFELDWVKYLGTRDTSIIDHFLKFANMVALPSYYPTECQPLSVIAGMVNGLDILIRNSAALLETVGDYPFVYYIEDDFGKCFDREMLLDLDPVQAVQGQVDRFDFNRFQNELRNFLEINS